MDTFEGRNVLVTGSGRGIGRGIALGLATAGAKVYALDCEKEMLEDLAKQLPSITTIKQDLRNWEQTKEMVSQIDKLDGLVNCAGVLTRRAANDLPKEQLDISLDVNLKAAINLMQVVGKKMLLNESGESIVNMSSVLGTLAGANVLSYCFSKAGLEMATKVFALELGPHNIRVNSVAPTICSNTVMVQMLPEEVRNALLSHIPMESMTELKDIVQCVLFLLSDKSKMITGTTLTIDGGHSCYLPV